MTRAVLRIISTLALAGTALAAISCRKAEKPAAPIAPPPPPQVEAPAPAQEFNDTVLQEKYEEAWSQHLTSFQPPSTGSLMYVRLNDGSFVGGTVQKLSDTNLVLKDGRTVVEVPRDRIAPEDLANVYLSPFAQAFSLESVTSLPGTTSPVVSLRYSLTDYPEPRIGPGPRFQLAENVNIDKGTTLLVMEERAFWMRVRPQQQPQAEPFWINRFTTIPAPGMPAEDASTVVAGLLESGYLAGLNIEKNEALVPRAAWAGTDTAVQEGITRVLAGHCARLRGSGVEWIEIKDVETGRKLGRYSQAQGFRAQ